MTSEIKIEASKSPKYQSKFCKSLEWTPLRMGGLDVEWFDRTGVYQLDEDRRVTFDLETRGEQGTYTGFDVTIYSKRTGRIVSKFFRFDTYLDQGQKARKDQRSGYPLTGNRCFCVIAHTGWRWYIAEPKSTAPFCKAVEAYVEAFR